MDRKSSLYKPWPQMTGIATWITDKVEFKRKRDTL